MKDFADGMKVFMETNLLDFNEARDIVFEFIKARYGIDVTRTKDRERKQ